MNKLKIYLKEFLRQMDENTMKTGISIFLLGIVFIALKIMGSIEWNWFLVLLPVLFTPIIIIIAILLRVILSTINRLFKK